MIPAVGAAFPVFYEFAAVGGLWDPEMTKRDAFVAVQAEAEPWVLLVGVSGKRALLWGLADWCGRD